MAKRSQAGTRGWPAEGARRAKGAGRPGLARRRPARPRRGDPPSAAGTPQPLLLLLPRHPSTHSTRTPRQPPPAEDRARPGSKAATVGADLQPQARGSQAPCRRRRRRQPPRGPQQRGGSSPQAVAPTTTVAAWLRTARIALPRDTPTLGGRGARIQLPQLPAAPRPALWPPQRVTPCGRRPRRAGEPYSRISRRSWAMESLMLSACFLAQHMQQTTETMSWTIEMMKRSE